MKFLCQIIRVLEFFGRKIIFVNLQNMFQPGIKIGRLFLVVSISLDFTASLSVSFKTYLNDVVMDLVYLV